MKKNILAGSFAISRPINVLISMLSIFMAAFITGTISPLSKVLLACFSGGIIMAASNTMNDYFDLDIDRVNRPKRPLVSGKLSPLFALRLAQLEFVVGIVLGLFISFTAFLIALSISSLIIIYSYKLKRMPLIGNLLVGFATGMAFIYGGVAVNRIRETVVPAVFSFFYHFGREIIKDVQDMQGDAAGHARTFPLVYGEKAALQLTTLNFIFLILLLPIPYLIRWYNLNYLIIILLGICPVLLYALYSIWKDKSPDNLGRISTLLKADMPIGLLAIYLG
jgi:geranylgeranylglycerol-phosphate geranylgeranyltransferase